MWYTACKRNAESEDGGSSMGKTTIHDVARAAHVSTATVSRVLNGDEKVGADYRARVEVAARRLGYHPQFSAR